MENHVKQLFINFILNRCSPSEIEEVKALVGTGDYEVEWRQALEATEQEFAHKEYPDLNINEARMFEKINQSIAASSSKEKQKNWTWIAAAAILLLVAGIGLMQLKTGEQPQKIAAIKSTTPGKSTARKWVKLPDGTSVQLNHDSYLEYADTFEGKVFREVRLTGEAYFDVKHDDKHPFVIYTGKIKTTVLGTAFNINAYDVDHAVTVTVTRGKVKVEDEKKVLAVLTPDQQLAWNAKLPEAQKVKVNAEEIVEWKKQDLIMDDLSLEDAAQMIAERYKVKIRFNNEKVKTCRFTAAFLNRNDITQVLSVVADITGATLTLKNNTVTIDGPGC